MCLLRPRGNALAFSLSAASIWRHQRRGLAPTDGEARGNPCQRNHPGFSVPPVGASEGGAGRLPSTRGNGYIDGEGDAR